MDTIMVHNSLSKVIKFSVISSFLLLFTSCPSNEDCNDFGSTVRVNDLITLMPEQEVYNQGEIIILKLTVPSVNTYFGNQVDLYAETNDDLVRVVMNSALFNDNILTFITGSMGEEPNWLYMPYNHQTESYELEVKIELNKIGLYSFVTDDFVEFIGDDCNRYFLLTNIQWSGDAVVEFTVNE